MVIEACCTLCTVQSANIDSHIVPHRLVGSIFPTTADASATHVLKRVMGPPEQGPRGGGA